MEVKQARFIISNTDVSKCPEPTMPEYAFIGRSNVGKSSFINALTNNKNLAKTSGRPGKTQLINHFLINEEWYLVDLPGYGYAKTSRQSRNQWSRFIEEYFLTRKNLMNTFILVDSRHEPQKIDLEFMFWCAENEIPFSLIFTKADKLTKVGIQKNIAAYKRGMLKYWEEMPPYFISSSVSGMGTKEVLTYIKEVNALF